MEVSCEEVRCETGNSEVSVSTEPTVSRASPQTSKLGDNTDNSKESVSSCSEDIGPDSGHTGTISSPVHEQDDVQISTLDVKPSTHSEQTQEARKLVTNEQNMVCDQPSKSAKDNTSEPDSSDSICVNSDNVEEIECDSGSTELAAQSSMAASETSVSGEVDSTQCVSSRHSDTSRLVSSAEQSSQQENNQCDSCSSERRDSSDSGSHPESSRQDSESVDSLALPGPSSVVDKPCISSTLLSSSVIANSVPNIHTSAHNLDKLSHVDSSTDKPRSRTNSVSGSLLEPLVITNSSSTSSSTIADNSSYQSVIDNEVSNSVNVDSIQSNFTSNLPMKSFGFGESYSVSSNSSIDAAPTQNRHLKFLNDSNYSTDMTVDSTTQLLPGVGAANRLNSGFPGVSNYDSDSMDVTSATEPAYGLGGDDGRRLSDDSMNSFPDTLSSSSTDSHAPKEKKKVNSSFDLIVQ